MVSESTYLTGNKEAINDFLDNFDVFLFDCDGPLSTPPSHHTISLLIIMWTHSLNSLEVQVFSGRATTSSPTPWPPSRCSAPAANKPYS